MSLGKGIKLSTGFDLNSKSPLDNRTLFESIAERDLLPDINLYDGLECFVKETKLYYQYINNTWVQRNNSTGGGDVTLEYLTSNYDSKTVVDDKLSGKVNKESGKGLSSNDFTNEQKVKLSTLNNYDDTDVKLMISGKAESNHGHLQEHYTKPEVDSFMAYSTESDSNIKTMKDALDKLLYVPLTVNFNTTVTIFEKGATVSNIQFNWSYNKNIQWQKFNNEIIDLTLRNTTYNTPFSQSKTFTLSASDGSSTPSRSIGVSFLNGRYWGVSTSQTYNNSLILSLNKELIESRGKTFTVNCGVGQYIYYCIPSRLGTPTFSVGGFSGGFNKVSTLSFQNNSGYSENYDIWKSTNNNLGNTVVVVG